MNTPVRPALLSLILSFLCAIPDFQPGGNRCAAADTPAAREIMAAAGFDGGLVVHVGCGDGSLTAAFAAAETTLVQGLDASPENVAAARRRVRELKLAGRVAISRRRGAGLPYVDNLVNLLVAGNGAAVSRDEILRVLAPGGTAYIMADGTPETIRKPRPGAMDEWTHYMYDATGNPVSRDTLVSPPRHLQWVGGPRWGRHHDHMASTSALVSAGNRLFYIFDEGSTASIILPSRWRLIARDAFNGVVLWKRAIDRWWTRFTPLKSGPAQLPRRLVAAGDRVYVTLGINAPVAELDAATGETLRTFAGTENTWEIVFSDGLLCAVTGASRKQEEEVEKHLFAKKNRAPGNPFNTRWKGWDRTLVAIGTETGKPRWKVSGTILPGTLAAADGAVYFHDGARIVARDAKTGAEQWVSKPVAAIDIEKGIPTGFMPSLVVDNGVIVFAGGKDYGQHMKGRTDTMVALRAKDGTILWDAPHYTSGYQSPEDLLVADTVVLTTFTTWLKQKDPKNNHVVGRALATGTPVFDNEPDVADPVWFIHHRCHPSKATDDYLLLSKEGVEFLDLKTRRWKIHHWIRGECLYGIMPANGLLYAPMHSCACSADMKLNGFNAVAGSKARTSPAIDVKAHRLTKGPAFGKVAAAAKPAAGDWPTYRHDAARSGVATCAAPASPTASWKTAIGGRLSAPVAAGGRVYVAAIDRHTLHALDGKTGAACWTFTADGRIDAPPTVYRGMVLFGSRDGAVYCLRAADGAVAWRFRPVAADRRLTAWEQVESAWPVHGSILVRRGEAWFVAGRSVFLDGGLQIYCLDPATGAVVRRATFDGRAPDGGVLTGAEEKRTVGLPDILSAAGGRIFMRAGVIEVDGDTITKRLLPKNKVIRYRGGGGGKGHDIRGAAHDHLFSSYGFLDDSWFHRSYWVYGGLCSHRHSYARTGRRRPAGRILVVDGNNVYGFGRQQRYFNWTTPLEYRLFAMGRKGNPKKALVWEKKSPGLLARALVLAGDTLFAAGPPDVLDETRQGIRNEGPETLKAMVAQEEALAGRRGGIMVAVSKADGAARTRIDIDAPPVFDGMIAAGGRLYAALTDGTVRCWGAKRE